MKALQRLSLFLGWLLLLPLGQVHAQVGYNNPTGISGIFNGNVTTGCSYDPYTANAMRTITDIVVAGAVGEYPLAFSRTANSRNVWNGGLGVAGGWRHNYDWYLENSPYNTQPNFPPAAYTVDFPDGRSETFQFVTWDPVDYRVWGTNGITTSAGVRDRFQPLNMSSLLGYLVLPDGGKVEFKATQHSYGQDWYYSYVAQAIIDPYGVRTSFTYNTDGTLSTITEAAGRWIQLIYGTVGTSNVITQVKGSDGRIINYNYSYSAINPNGTLYAHLDSVDYFSTWTAYYSYQIPNVGSANGVPLLKTCDDPMYPGPMRGLAYTYRTANNPDGSAATMGQIQSENYYNTASHAIGSPVSTLTVGAVGNSNIRTETRGDGSNPTRTFTYLSTGYLSSCTDFNNKLASQTYDSTTNYINAVTDRNQKVTNFTSNSLTGVVTQVQFPAAADVTPSPAPRGTVTYTYGSSGCSDTNNKDANNPYYVCTATDEGHNVTQFTRDNNKRVTQINYPDAGYETFGYNSFGEVTSHRMRTGGTETFTYDMANGPTKGCKLTYCDPYHAGGNPANSASYSYEVHGWLSGVTDALTNTTNYDYNLRGQVWRTTFPAGPDHIRRTIVNSYNTNGDGTLVAVTNQISQTTNYTYDDYRRLASVITPPRFTGDNSSHTTSYSYYDSNGTGWYTHTDSNASQVALPSGKLIANTYDANFRKTSVIATAADGVTDRAKTSYGYDNVGNLTTVTDPLNNPPTTTLYDERNRPYSVTDALLNSTTCTYDTAGHKNRVTRANGQIITYDSYDQMNRLTQQTAYQNPDPPATTIYTYYPSGLLKTLKDPYLVAGNINDAYTYVYDQMGRKWTVTYPQDSAGVHRMEYFTYDTVGRLGTFQNRWANVDTFTYDALSRLTLSSWNDGGTTPDVSFGYDDGSRLTSVTNANATILRYYFNDNLLSGETTTYPAPDNRARAVNYTYDADANRATIQYPAPSPYSFTYNYTGRNQLQSIVDNNLVTIATYWYDVDGNLIQRNPGNGTSSAYGYDALNRAINITHSLNAASRRLQYGYDSVGNREWTWRDNGNGDAFSYDLSDQVTGVALNIPNPNTTTVSQNISYDANGNRIIFAPFGTNDSYSTGNNNLNQYSQRNSANAAYNINGDMTTGFDGSTYTYDAQNRLLSASKTGTTETFAYDGLNRQVSRTIGGVPTYNVYDGWDLIGEYAAGAATPTTAYVSGAGGLVKNLVTNNYYYQDASGSTSHLADSTGHLIEWYRYDLQGTPIFYNSTNKQLSASNYGIRHLFTGQQWYSELGLYDLRNRYYSPDIGRFLQADPAGFSGDATNLYRYCGNNPLKWRDLSGLDDLVAHPAEMGLPGVVVDGSETPNDPLGDLAIELNVLEQQNGSTGLGDILASNPDGGGPGGFNIRTGVTAPGPKIGPTPTTLPRTGSLPVPSVIGTPPGITYTNSLGQTVFAPLGSDMPGVLLGLSFVIGPEVLGASSEANVATAAGESTGAIDAGTASAWDTAIPQTGELLNVGTNVTATEFQANLVSNGFNIVDRSVSVNGQFTVLSNGQTTYTIYTATSTGAPSVEVFNSTGQAVLKYRLGGP
jgi:RHS repeat-associated protein